MIFVWSGISCFFFNCLSFLCLFFYTFLPVTQHYCDPLSKPLTWVFLFNFFFPLEILRPSNDLVPYSEKVTPA